MVNRVSWLSGLVLLVMAGVLSSCGGVGGVVVPAGSLVVAVSGLAGGVDADVLVLGPDGFRRVLTEGGTLTGLTAGSYGVLASMVVDAAGAVHAPVEPSVVVTLSGASGQRVAVMYEIEPVVLSDDAVVLSDATLSSIVGFTPAAALGPSTLGAAVASVAHGEFVFSVDSPELQALKVGDVFAVGARPEVPVGAIGRVTQIDRSAGTVRVRTAAARLADSVERGAGLARGAFSPADVVSSASVHPELAVSALPSSGSALCWSLEGTLTIDAEDGVVVPGIGDTNAVVHGEYCLEPGAWQIEIKQRGRNDVYTAMTVEWDVTSSVVITFEQDIGFDSGFLPLHTLTFAPSTFAIGSVPVVIVPQVQIGVELEGVVTVGAGIGFEQRVTMTTGGRLDSGVFSPVFSWDPVFSLPTDGRFVPVLGATAEVGAGAKARFMLYGVTGGFVEAVVFSAYESHAVDSRWELKTGFKPAIGWEFDVWVYKPTAEHVLFPDALTRIVASGSFSGIGVSVLPAEATVSPGETLDFTAVVTGSTAGVTWALAPAECGSLTPTSGGARFVATSEPASRTCTITATSVEDTFAKGFAVVVVTPPGDAPAISGLAVAPDPVDVGESVSIQWSVTSPEPPVTCWVDVDDDGSADDALYDCSAAPNTVMHAYAEPGTYTVVVTATDDRAQSTSATTTVTVQESGGGVDPAPSYISISNVSLGAASGGTRRVGFDISWDESWRGPDRPTWVEAADNWDAVWVFVKYRVSGGPWQHATLAGNGHVQPSGSVVSVPSDRMGAFVYRSGSGYGTFAANGVGLQWDYVADGVSAGASVDVQPFAVEMVFVPQGSFSVGSGGSNPGEFRAGGTSNTPFVVSSQSSIALGNAAGQLMWSSTSGSGSPSGSTSASFPTGFGASYVMKYQVTQGQYVDFLNTLTQAQADARKHTGSSFRHAVAGSNVGSYATSLPFVAMNYMSWADGAAFADWAGLRPMTEMEFEKVARGPRAPVANEYAWGSTSITPASGLANAGTITETPTPAGANANYVSGIGGPVRVGSFAAPARSRRDAGAGFYGALELSGNVWERPMTVGNAEGRAFAGTHGDGSLDAGGNANVASWPGSDAVGAGLRGGYWDYGGDDLRVSFRFYAATTLAYRSSIHGWRGARSAP